MGAHRHRTSTAVVLGAGQDQVEILEQGPGQQQAQAERPRITTRYLTKYEKARVLGTRALQVGCGEWSSGLEAGGEDAACCRRCCTLGHP